MPSLLAPSVPQKRILALIEADVSSFLRDSPVGGGPGMAEIRKFLRENLDIYNKFGHILPVSAKAGLPNNAATVDTAKVLRKDLPVLSEQGREPFSLLLPREEWPSKLPPPFVKVDDSYPEVLRGQASRFTGRY